MTTLSQVCEAIAGALKGTVPAPGPWPSLAVRIGGKWLANNEDAPPRMVFLLPRPGEETFEAPDFVGERTGHRPKAFRTRVAPIEVHCLAVSAEDTERLGHDLASEIHKSAHGSYTLISGGYLSEGESGWSQFGEVYVLRFAVRQPILSRPMGSAQTVATATGVALKTTVQDPATGAEETDVDYPP